MSYLNIFINSEKKYSIDDADYINTTLCIYPDDRCAEFQVYSGGSQGMEILYSEKISEGDIVSICNFEDFPENLYFQDKKDVLREMHKKSNLGNPCRKHLHIVNDKHDQSNIFVSGDSSIQFEYALETNSSNVSLCVGIFDNTGVEQWHQSKPCMVKYVEFVYLNVKGSH
jgi:hypothetical protein